MKVCDRIGMRIMMTGTTGLLVCASALAQNATAPDRSGPLTRQVLEVNEHGAFVRESYSDGRVMLDPSQGSISMVTTPRWIDADNGLLWSSPMVALGDDGAILMAGKGLNNESVTMYGTGSSTPVFDFSTVGSEAPIVDVADHAGVAASMIVVDQDQGQGYDFEATVHVWTTTSNGTPAWSYTYPRTLNYFGGGVAVSDNGQVILTWKADPNINMLRVEAFTRNGNSISSGLLGYDTNIHSRQTRLSDDGSRAYFNIGARAYIYDVASGTVEYEHNIGASFDSHALSGDGKRFAFGNFGFFRVYEEISQGNWSQVATRSVGGGTFVAQVDLNADGSRLGYTVQRYSPAYDHIEIGMYDVDNSTELFNTAYDAPGTSFQLSVRGCEIDDAGDYVAGCSWGDSFGATPEGFVYDAAGNATCELDSLGSAFFCDLDSAGDVFAMGTKGAHANEFGNGGDVYCSDAYEQDLHVTGFARAGQTVTLQVARTGSSAQIAVCRSLGSSNTPLGQSELNLNTLLQTIGPVSIPNGGLNRVVTIPNGLAGQIVHLQAGISGGQNPHLSNKVSVRIQP